MLILKNDWLEAGISENDGCFHTLRVASPSALMPYEYVEKTSLTDSLSNCLWGQWELRDSFNTYKPSDAKVSVRRDQNRVISQWETSLFSLSIKRELHASHLAETVKLTAKRTMAVIDFNVAFRPAITNFLDASNVSVGEHNSFIPSDEPRSAFHWFTGGNYAHLMFTQVTGHGPHLGIVLTEGRIHGFTTPYLHGGTALINDYQAFGTYQMYPRLHVTAFATHKQADEYPQPILDMRTGDTETFTLFYFPFDQLDEFPERVRSVCKQPTFDYPRFWPVNKDLNVFVQLPDSALAVSARYGLKTIPVEKITDQLYKVCIRPEQSGLHRIDLFYGSKQTFILFEAVHNAAELLDRRVEYILSTQQCLSPTDTRYGGIFMTDMQTGKWHTKDDLYTVQVAGSGEMVATAQLVVYRNLIDPDPNQIKQAEIYANHWLRLRCQDEDFSTPLNPLNRMKYKDRGWKYEQGRARIFNNPDFPLEKAWRIHNANWIVPFYYLLSEIPDELLTMQSSATYLDWAYRTIQWQLDTEPWMSADQSYFIPRVIQKLRRVGQEDAAAILQKGWQAFVTRIEAAANSLANGFFSFDDSMFYCSAIPLLLESKVEAARCFLDSFPYNVGISYDPRVQTTFRYWDDYLTDLPYAMMPYLTRPHFWSITDSYPLLQLYEATHDESVLHRAYQGILAFYEHYNFSYRWNKWGQMKLGQGHPCFLPSQDLHTQERVCADQDPAFVTYLETFGSRCYLTHSRTAVNGLLVGKRLESWAPFPRAYHLDDRNLTVRCKPYSLVMPWLEFDAGSIKIQVKNLSRNAVDGQITVTGLSDQSLAVSLKPYSEQLVFLRISA